MRTKMILFIAASLLGSLSCWSQEAKLDDIITAYYKATGIEKMKDWQSIITSGK